jgi:hypothetical protein
MAMSVKPQLLNQFAADIKMNPHELRVRASEEDINLIVAATHFKTENIEESWVQLTPRDILGSLNKDYVEATRLIVGSKEISLSEKVSLRDGLLYVSEDEREKFRELRQNEEATIHQVFDSTHPNYSQTLDAALSAWIAVCSGEMESNRPKQQIVDWLKSNYPQFRDGTIDRIASVVNPRKQGGRPKDES